MRALNVQDRPKRHKGSNLYHSDFYAWTREQARLLRARQFDKLGLDHVAEEMEGVGASEKREIRNRLKVLLAGLLNWRYQPQLRGSSWGDTINEQHDAIVAVVEDSPSLAGFLREVVPGGYRGAKALAARETGISSRVFPKELPFAVDQVLDPDFLPDEPGEA